MISKQLLVNISKLSNIVNDASGYSLITNLRLDVEKKYENY